MKKTTNTKTYKVKLMRKTCSSTCSLRWCVDTGDWFYGTLSSCSSRSMINSRAGGGGSDGSSSRTRISCGCEKRESCGWNKGSENIGWVASRVSDGWKELWMAEAREEAQTSVSGWRLQTEVAGEGAQRHLAGWRSQTAMTDQEM